MHAGLDKQHYKYSDGEPAINRYSTGGHFHPHRDGCSLTLNVLLAEGTFEGGGTQFWREVSGQEMEQKEEQEPTLCVLPRAGVGVVFNGKVKHAGRVVSAGLRHLLVASFTIAASAT